MLLITGSQFPIIKNKCSKNTRKQNYCIEINIDIDINVAYTGPATQKQDAIHSASRDCQIGFNVLQLNACCVMTLQHLPQLFRHGRDIYIYIYTETVLTCLPAVVVVLAPIDIPTPGYPSQLYHWYKCL